MRLEKNLLSHDDSNLKILYRLRELSISIPGEKDKQYPVIGRATPVKKRIVFWFETTRCKTIYHLVVLIGLQHLYLWNKFNFIKKKKGKKREDIVNKASKDM